MKKNMYQRVIQEIRTNAENIWDLLHAKPTNDMPPVYVTIPLDMVTEITDRAVLRTLESAADLIERYNEIPTLSRTEAAKMLGKTTKTLREWENNGTLKPSVYLGASPYYRVSDIESKIREKGMRLAYGK